MGLFTRQDVKNNGRVMTCPPPRSHLGPDVDSFSVELLRLVILTGQAKSDSGIEGALVVERIQIGSYLKVIGGLQIPVSVHQKQTQVKMNGWILRGNRFCFGEPFLCFSETGFLKGTREGTA